MNSKTGNSGFTLVELIVSIAILTAVILIVSTLLTNAQRAVGMSQDTIKADADARTIVDRLRADLAGLTAEGFLAIRNHRFQYQGVGDWHYAGQLIFTTVGPYRSVTSAWNDNPVDSDDILANSGIIYFGHAMMPGLPPVPVWDVTAPKPDKWVLMRRLTLMTPGLSPNVDEPGYDSSRHYDYQNLSLSFIRSLPYDLGSYDTDTSDDLWELISRQTSRVSAGAPDYTWDYLPLSRVVNPYPNSLGEVRDAWPYLARGCSNFLIEWTDGSTVGNNLQWFGGYDDAVPGWTTFGLTTGEDVSVGNERYFVDFTFRYPDDWPVALRITFTLGEGGAAQTYEIIVDLPR